MSSFTIDTLHKKGGKEVYIVSIYLDESKTLTAPLFPGKVFEDHEEAFDAAMEKLDLWNPRF